MKSSTGLVLFSHGSLLCGAGRMLQNHAELLRRSGRYVAVEPGYLNYCDPPVELAIAACVKAGADTVIIVPYFLIAGKFVSEDLPLRLEPARAMFPKINFKIARALEDNMLMKAAVETLLSLPRDPKDWQSQAMEQVRVQCSLREECPLFGTEACRVGESADVCQEPARHVPRRQEIIARGASEPTSPAVLLILHGSPKPIANEPALRIADCLRESGKYTNVSVAYLDCNEPTIPEAIRGCVEMGVRRIIAAPYFLHTGRHQVLDVPRLLLQSAVEFPQLHIQIADPVGMSPLVAEALAQRADEALK